MSRPQLYYRPVSIGSVYFLLLLCVPLKSVLFCLVNMLGGCTSHDSAAFVWSIDLPTNLLMDSMASMVSFCVSSFPAPSESCINDSAVFFLLGAIRFWCKIKVRILLLLNLLFFFLGKEVCYRYNLLWPPSLWTIPCSEVLSFSLS